MRRILNIVMMAVTTLFITCCRVFDVEDDLYDIAKEQELVNAQVELVRAQNDLESVQSALDAHQSSSEVDSRLEIAKNDLKVAWDAYNSLSVK